MSEKLRKIEVTVALWIDADADPAEVVMDLDYNFEHPAIGATEILDINTEV